MEWFSIVLTNIVWLSNISRFLCNSFSLIYQFPLIFLVTDFNYLSVFLSLFLAIIILKFSLRCCSFISQRIFGSRHSCNTVNSGFFTGTVSQTLYEINCSCLRHSYSKLHLVHSLLSGGLNVNYSQQPEPAVKPEILIS